MANSIRSIARELGIDPSTVSRGLRGEGRMSTELRAKIRAAADRAGYRPHPLLAEALSLSRQSAENRYHETFALILEFPSEGGPDYQQLMHYAAEKHAASMGYKLEPFIVGGKPADHRRFSKIFRSRGIRGLIIIPRLLRRQPRLHFDWDLFATVEIGQTVWYPRNLHSVDSHSYPKIIDTVHMLKRAGYRRIGMAVETLHNFQKSGIYYGAYLMSQLRLPPSQQIPIYAADGRRTEDTFREWVNRYRPEVVLLHRYSDICLWLDNMGLRMPEDISLFQVDVRKFTDDPEPYLSIEWSGIRCDYEGIGKRAVDTLVTLLRNGEMGLATNPVSVYVDEFWVDGRTLSRPITELIQPPAGGASAR